MADIRHELRKFVAPEFIIGEDARLLAGRYAKNYSVSHVMVVTDDHMLKTGWISSILESLTVEGIRYTIFSDVLPNPRDYEVMKGADLYRKSGCDALVAIGGGSPIDCAKGIGIVVNNHSHILDYEGVDNIPVSSPPLICIPTTAGSAADVSQFAVINDSRKKVKITIISKKIVPDISLIDPVPLTTLPKELTAHTGMDAIVHSIEAYVSNASSPVTDIHALESIRIMSTYLPLAYQNPENLHYRYQTLLGSLLAGLAFSNASLGIVHAMAHSLGGEYDLPHGECNALLLESAIEFNFSACPERYLSIGRTLGVEYQSLDTEQCKRELIQALTKLRESVGIVQRFRQIGVSRDSIPELARNAIHDPCLATNPREPDIRDIEQIYARAL
ncbi:MAG TPA: alcohol dehydrogenase-like regulatory protein ErcA [Methanospirillum sp.]|uniref:alcohol dehydrogenase-like regulatory protein ErcA n=1 Tax=Methanospirillum sp. TaxID=45200 RepID=UPI002CBC1FBE|nr:alcohol dehydrogenase-like regulatory protein ErcA [Methanospirillum sp.]HWQ63981.1 alcohol dehydrogenase-like regulatory protein ErcA [Methanospirillum sp.]